MSENHPASAPALSELSVTQLHFDSECGQTLANIHSEEDVTQCDLRQANSAMYIMSSLERSRGSADIWSNACMQSVYSRCNVCRVCVPADQQQSQAKQEKLFARIRILCPPSHSSQQCRTGTVSPCTKASL